jgi:TrmH family RNA methyltransferase
LSGDPCKPTRISAKTLEKKRITSSQNARIKSLVRLGKKHERDRTDLILIEGYRELERAIEAGVSIEEIYFSKALLPQLETRLLSNMPGRGGIHFLEVSDPVLEKITYRGGSSGLVAVGKRPHRTPDDIPGGKNPLYVIVDAVEKPGNLGAILRSADGAGVTGVIASDERTDLYHPNVIRASLGTIFTVPTVVTTAGEAIAWLHSRDAQIVVTTPSAEILYSDADLKGPTAIVVGSEDTGAKREWLEAADITVRIPMRGGADSLNVAQAATILMYEALRQRSAAGGR